MMSFWPAFGLAFIAATLLTSAASHAARFASFRDLIADHAIVASRVATPAALLTFLVEAVLGAAALFVLVQGADGVSAVLVFMMTAALGAAFLLYIRQLLGRPRTSAGCGCSPLSSPLTAASQIPSAALAAVSAAGLASVLLSYWTLDADSAAGALSVLAPLWGATMAVLIMLAPASVPAAMSDDSR